MKPHLDNAGILSDTFVLNNTGHSWPVIGNGNAQFSQAVDFSSDFLYPLLPCNNSSVGIIEKENIVKQYPNPANDLVHYSSKKIIKKIVIYNQFGQIKSNILVNNTEFDMSLKSFDKGIYHLRLFFDDSSLTSKKLSVYD